MKGAPPDPGGLWGRQAGRVLVWSAILYLVAVGFATVIPQVFAPEARAVAFARCDEGIRPMKDELLSRMQPVPHGSPAHSPEFRAWRDRWDSRAAGLRPVCDGDGADAYAALVRLRHRLETRKRRADHEVSPLLRQLELELDKLSIRSDRPSPNAMDATR